MGIQLGPRRPNPGGSRPGASFGLVTELVSRDEAGDREEEAAPRSRMGVIRVGDQATVCRVEHLPTPGDVIRGEVTLVVDRVRVGRTGRVTIFAHPLVAPEP